MSLGFGIGLGTQMVRKSQLPAPQNFIQTNATADTIDLQWDPVVGAEGYEITNDGSTWQTTGGLTTWTFSGVSGCMTVWVRAFGLTSGAGEYSELYACTSEGGGPTQLPDVSHESISASAADQIYVSWFDPGNVPVGFRVILWNASMSFQHDEQTISPGTYNTTFFTVPSGSTYEVFIINLGDGVSWSDSNATSSGQITL